MPLLPRRRPLLVHAHMVDVARAKAGDRLGPVLLRDAAFGGPTVRERIERELGVLDVMTTPVARILAIFIETTGTVVWSTDRVTVHHELPLTVIPQLIRHMLGEVVDGLPDGTHHLRILDVESGHGTTTFTLDAPLMPARRIPIPLAARLATPFRRAGWAVDLLTEITRPRRRDGMPTP